MNSTAAHLAYRSEGPRKPSFGVEICEMRQTPQKLSSCGVLDGRRWSGFELRDPYLMLASLAGASFEIIAVRTGLFSPATVCSVTSRTQGS